MNDKFFIQQMENKYPDFLRSIIREKPFMPIPLRGGKQKPDTTDELHTAIRFFQKHERSAETPGWTIDWKPWKTKKFGNQVWPEVISILTEKDYLFLLNKETEFFTFRSILDQLLTWNPLVRDWLVESPLVLLKQRPHWEDICATVDFFLHHDVSAFYIRSLPIPVHSKFVEQNKTIIHSLLSYFNPQRFPKDGRDFEDVVSLAQLPHLYPIRWLDSRLSLTYTAGMDILAIPYHSLLKTNWLVKEIWVVENETNLYLLPQRAEERAAVRYLWKVQGRLEQEKLEQQYVQQYIRNID